MRIGIVPVVDSSAGGIYQYSLTIVSALGVLSRQRASSIQELILFLSHGSERFMDDLGGKWTTQPLAPPTAKRKIINALRDIGAGWVVDRIKQFQVPQMVDIDARVSQPAIERWMLRFGLDFIIYPAPSSLAFEVRIPSMMAVHDLQHRLQPEFPEVSADGEWERREHTFRNAARHATMLLADSEVGKEDILECYSDYGAAAEQIGVLPFLPAHYLQTVDTAERERVRAKYRLPGRYLFYPAQFWAHKNHARIVEALASLNAAHGLDIPLVLSGSKSGVLRESVFQELMNIAQRGNIRQNIRYLGYVDATDMSALYAEAVALVMPTFFGPTNIPILEAWASGCPVITSDIRGVRDQAGEAAVLVNPRSVDAIADGIYQVWTNEALRRRLIENGRERLNAYTFDDFCERLRAILDNMQARVSAKTGAAG